jgi:hypothetical protein
MMRDLMVASTIELAAFPALVQSWKIDTASSTFILLESVPRHIVEPHERQDLLRFELFQPDLDFTRYQSGRIFHESGEVRWEGLSPNEVQVVYTGTPEYRLALANGQQTTLAASVCERVARNYFLFGKRLEKDDLERIGPVARTGDFAEVRIPRLLRYPRLPALERVERVQLALYEYVDLATGATLAYRFRDLVPFQPRAERTSEREEKRPA